VFLERNDLFLITSEPEIFRYVLQVARHGLVSPGMDLPDREVLAMSEWLNRRLSPVTKGEKRLRFGDLRRILASHGCEFQVLPGNRILISRHIPKPRWFRQATTLQSHVAYGDEGRDTDPTTVRKIRKDLWLDEEHGFDSSIFYGSSPGVDEFIAMYRKTLKRLARL